MEVLGRGEGRGETIGTRTLSQRPTLPDSKHGQQPAIRTMEDKEKKTVMNSPTLGWIFIQ